MFLYFPKLRMSPDLPAPHQDVLRLLRHVEGGALELLDDLLTTVPDVHLQHGAQMQPLTILPLLLVIPHAAVGNVAGKLGDGLKLGSFLSPN